MMQDQFEEVPINQEETPPFLQDEEPTRKNMTAVRGSRGTYATPVINPQRSILNDLGNGIENLFNNMARQVPSTAPAASRESQQFPVASKSQQTPASVNPPSIRQPSVRQPSDR